MNPEQQRERFTHTQRLEKRLEDLELVVETLAVEIVRDRTTITDDLAVFNERLRVYAELEAGRLDATDSILAGRLEAFAHMTLWQRLRWLVRGAA